MPNIKPLEEILAALQHPIDSVRGTYNEFMGAFKRPDVAYGNQQPQGLQQMQPPIPQSAPPLSDQNAYQQPSAWQGFINKWAPAPERKPYDELKDTTQWGQLETLRRGIR